jgi:hypothetical protein
MATGDDLDLGNGNSAQTPTVILASLDKDGFSDFDLGRAIFEAGPTGPPDTPQDPFMGVLGRGADAHPNRLIPGMPGVAGYGGRPAGATDDRQGGCGVMGIGGSTDGEAPHASAKWGPGPGIYGVGGAGLSSAHGAGVIGDSGITDLGEVPADGVGVPTLPSVAETQNVGVYGRSQNGPGVAGYSIGDRGGVFSSSQVDGPSLPQLRLIPQPGTFGVSIPPLPKNGQPGDFFVRTVQILVDVPPRAELWFCTGPATPNPASVSRWGLVAFSEIQEV